MENLFINGTDNCPEIVGEITGEISISGKSMAEDSITFFNPVHDWVKALVGSSVEEITIKIKLVYFNSSSAKQLLKLLLIIDDSEKKAKVIWVFPSGNDLLEERGKEFEIMLDLPFDYLENEASNQ
ncbi:MAG: SiaC family regulatory phosphoprotein [Flavobacteriales bacterium]|nr:SiaC family regulatory phosphoprotein [Flavobacteriales bacterium]